MINLRTVRPLLSLTALPTLALLGAALTAQPPTVNSIATLAAFLSLFLVLNGFFVSAEYAIVTVHPAQIEALHKEGHPHAEFVLGLLQDSDAQDRFITTAQIGIVLVSLGLGMYAAPQIAAWLQILLGRLLPGWPVVLLLIISYGAALALLTYLHLLLGEMMPKVLWETTLNPETRRLLRVDIQDGLETDRVVSDLMGKDASARFQFIMEGAEQADELDV